LTEINISEFNKVVIIVKEKGFDINFTAQELYDVIKNVELKTSLLTTEQKY